MKSLLPLCSTCDRYNGVQDGIGLACDAYPQSIPVEILANAVDHTTPYKGDHGLQYKAVAQDSKVSKESVDYSLGKKESHCGICAHFEEPNSCEIVEGKIDPAFWCKRFLASQTAEDDNWLGFVVCDSWVAGDELGWEEVKHPRDESGKFAFANSSKKTVLSNAIKQTLLKKNYKFLGKTNEGHYAFEHENGHKVHVGALHPEQEFVGKYHIGGSNTTGSGAGALKKHLEELHNKGKEKEYKDEDFFPELKKEKVKQVKLTFEDFPELKKEVKKEVQSSPKEEPKTANPIASKTKLDFAQARFKASKLVSSAGNSPVTDQDKREIVDIVGSAFDLVQSDKNNVAFSDENKTFTLNGQTFDYGGSADGITGKITLYPGIKDGDIAPILAHEMMHIKYHTVLNEYRKELTWIRINKHMDTKTNEIKSRHKDKYPVVAVLGDFLNPNAKHTEALIRDDGVTLYSKEWWQRYDKDPSASAKLSAEHETLAEMALLEWRGELDTYRNGWYEKSKEWRNLYENINKLYQQVPKYGEVVKRPYQVAGK